MYDIIINGEAITEMSKLEPESIDLIFAEPLIFSVCREIKN